MSDMSKQTELPVLTSVEVEPGGIIFDPMVNEYTIKLEDGVNRILVRARTADADARYTVSDTDLVQGRNEIMITVTGSDGMQNIYRLHVIVGEELETETEEVSQMETAKMTEALQQTVNAGVQSQTEASLSFMEHITTGNNRYITIGICGCAGFALLLWIAFAIKRVRTAHEKKRQMEQRQLAKQEREKRFEMARMQQEELLRQIDELKRKSRSTGLESSSGLRIIHLDDEYDENETDDDYYDDIDEYDEYYDSDREYDEEDSDDN